MKDEKWNKGRQMAQKSDDRAASKDSPCALPSVTAGQSIVIRRDELDWSQEELSWRSGVSISQIGRIERGECIPSMSTIVRLETALDMDLNSLFLAQKREQSISQRDKKRIPRDAIDNFSRKIVQTGIAESDLKDVLSEALKTAENLSKRKKSK